MKNILPEQAGISSENVNRFINYLNKREVHLHSMLLLKGNDLFFEAYWSPFNKDTPHRMYSVTKSFMSVAVGLAEEDGLIDLDKPIVEYFPEKIDSELCYGLKMQTVREMLTMTTVGPSKSWFTAEDKDRIHLYFNNRGERRPSGTAWQYDSPGSQVLGALVEKVTGKCLFDYLNERIFLHLNAFKNAKILKTPTGESWCDSALICTPRDLIAFARFVMNRGTYDGKRLMNAAYLEKATSKIVDNRTSAHSDVFKYGYGYQFWRTENNGFAFVGMGDQLAVCMPDQDVIMVCTCDNQGNKFARQYIVSAFMDMIIENIDKDKDVLLKDSNSVSPINSYDLFAVKGADDSPIRDLIDGVTYSCKSNPLGWYDFCFHFDNKYGGNLVYTKESGKKTLYFYVNKNRFGKFDEEGYSNEVGGVRTTDGHKYNDAVSFAWLQDNKILLFVQIIDEYLGNTSIVFSFKGNKAVISAEKNAEDFLWDYSGEALAEII